jgi:hypothetical protein
MDILSEFFNPKTKKNKNYDQSILLQMVETIDNVDQVIGRMGLPSCNYIIIGEASVPPDKLNGQRAYLK